MRTQKKAWIATACKVPAEDLSVVDRPMPHRIGDLKRTRTLLEIKRPIKKDLLLHIPFTGLR